MPRGKKRDLSLRVQVLRIESGEVVDRPVHECDVGAPVAKQPSLLADLAQQHIHRYRIGPAGDRSEQPLQQLDGRPGLRREHQRAVRVAGTPRSTRGGRDAIKSRAGLVQQHASGVGEGHSPTVPYEQLDAEALLEPSDRAGQRRLCDPEPNGGASEVQFLRDGDEVPQFAGLEVCHKSEDTGLIPHGYLVQPDRSWPRACESMSMDQVNDTKTALITGANKGIGFAIAQGLGAAGFTVAVGARDDARREEAVDRLRTAGVDAFGVTLDVTSDSSVAAAAATIEQTAGRLDVLVNNAGISGRTDDSAQNPTTLDLDVVRTVLDTNVLGVVRVTNAMLPLLRRADSPRIVNMSSNMGSLTLQTGPIMAAYAPSKSMLNSVTAQYARQLADTNIIVNAGCPGYVATDFTGFNGPRTPAQGAAIAIRLATLPDDGPRGGFFDDQSAIPW